MANKKKLGQTDVAYWRKRGYSLAEAKHRVEFTARGTVRKTSEQRSKVAKKSWKDRWADGRAVKVPKKKRLSPKERSERGKVGWVTRRKNERKAERAVARSKPSRRVAVQSVGAQAI